MIEQIMFFALGILSATLVALLVLPAVWHRAVRLTTRRVEAAVPVSIFEIQADKDQQRAAFALSQRRLELQLDQTRATIVTQAATIEEQRLQVFDLDKRLTAKIAEHDALAIAHADLEARFATQGADLADKTLLLNQATTTLANTRAALAATSTALTEQISRTEELQVNLAERDAALLGRDGRIMELERHLSDERTAHGATGARLTDTEALLWQTQTEAGAQAVKAAETEARLSSELSQTRRALMEKIQQSEERGTALAERTLRVEELEAALAIATQDLESTRSALHVLEHRRSEDFTTTQAETRRLSDALDMLKADHAMMSAALDRARAARDAAQGGAPEAVVAAPEASPPQTVKREATTPRAMGDAERTALKETILDLAAKVAARAADAPGSALPELLAREEPLEAHAHGPTLAARIRAARAADGAPEAEPETPPYVPVRQAAGE